MTDTLADPMVDPVTELTAWLEENWDPDLTIAEWWSRLGDSGWAAPTLPREWFGRGLSREDGVRVYRVLAEFGAVLPPGGLGLMLAAPTIALMGNDEQKGRYLRDLVTGQAAWCQLFSEPGAGSDLAGLGTRAIKDGDHWIVNGQKVWTSTAMSADYGMLLARTDIDVPKHQGITYFAVDMHQPGIEVRPLRELTGRALFNEVFLTDAVVEDAAAIGGVNNGWAVANATLTFERAGLGAGGAGGGGGASPGTIAGDLDRRAGDFVRARRTSTGARVDQGVTYQRLADLAKEHGTIDAPGVRSGIVELYTLNEIARFTNLRSRAMRDQGKEIPGAGNLAKLSMSRMLRLSRQLSLQILGPYGTLHAYTDEERAVLVDATGEDLTGITEAALFAQAPMIYGGTDEIQHNIIGERALGLPKEPGPARTTPYRDLPKNG